MQNCSSFNDDIKMAIVPLLFLNFIVIAAYDRSPHRNEAIVEKFKFGDYYFIFYSKSANWAEAYTICQATGSRLAVVNTLDRAKFLSSALSQTKTSFEDVWIGGHFNKDVWQWLALGKTIGPPEEGFPPWLKYPTMRGKNCLSLDRRKHWEPIFIELKCNLYRPFVCEESVSGSIDRIPEAATDTFINNQRYFLYRGRVTWQEALAFCKESGTELAVVPDVDTAQKLADLMKRSRPSFENVWIGARRDTAGWMWVPTQEMLENEAGENGFPPWRFGSPTDNSKTCVILDHHPCTNPLHLRRITFRHHFCEEAVFIEENCGLKKDFLCQIPGEVALADSKPLLLTVDLVTYIFYEEPLTWEEAMWACMKINMTLATPETEKQLMALINFMGDLQRELYHVWLGGKWIPNEWLWLNNHAIPLPQLNQTYPPWCMSEPIHDDDEDCLNLDRDAHNTPLIYGFNCSIQQPFVCQVEDRDYIQPCNQIEGEFQLNSLARTFQEALWNCKINHTHLATVNSSEMAQKIALFLPRNVLVWVGARRLEGIWRWLETKEIIPDVASINNYPPWEDTYTSLGKAACLAMKSGYKEQPYFVEKPCKEKLFYVCQQDTKEIPQPFIYQNYNGIKYYFYNVKVPWKEAMYICNSVDAYLVNVGHQQLAKYIIDMLLDYVPTWTSGKQLADSSWTWITSGQKLPNKINQGYPLWANDNIPKDKDKTCLQLNSTEGIPAFEAEDCLQNRTFVCVDRIVTFNETDIEINNLTISMPDLITNFLNAKLACTVNDKKILDILQINYEKLIQFFKMEHVKSFWLDVFQNNASWYYMDPKREFKSNISFSRTKPDLSEGSKNCLTLQLEEKDTLLLVPTDCSDYARVLCVSATKSIRSVEPQVVHQLSDIEKLTAILEGAIYNQSELVCKDLGGELINQLLSAGIEFFKTLQPQFTSFWLAAKYKNNSWALKDGTPLQLEDLPDSSTLNFSDERDTAEKYCLIYNRGTNKVEEEDCNKRHSILCESVEKMCAPKSASTSILWWPEKCTTGPLREGTVCRSKCWGKFDRLMGPELHFCLKGKWSYEYEVACRGDREIGKAVAQTVRKQIVDSRERTSYFIFILDCGIPHKTFSVTIQFAKNLGNTVPLGSKRRISLQLYSLKNQIYNMLENNNCYLVRTADEIDQRYKQSKTRANYYNAFLRAKQEIEAVNSRNSFIFFFAMRSDSGSVQNRTKLVEELKKEGVTFIVVSVGNDVNRNALEEIASTRYGALQLYLFKSILGMRDASVHIRKSSYVKSILHDCAYGGLVL